MPAAKRLRVTIQLAALLTADERFQLVKQGLADLPDEVHHRLADLSQSEKENKATPARSSGKIGWLTRSLSIAIEGSGLVIQ
ncbi:MAG: hypothetical protein E6K70_12220 [Planctomycetota bacterium]|nr:MAG: hypothetical protein E6K70_12220 [Planctomycetota bacterium]